MRVVWSPLAEVRAGEALEVMLRERPTAAATWLGRLLTGVAQLGRFPERGRMVPEVGRKDIREVMQAPYRVVYRVDAKRVVILTVRHMRRDFDLTEVQG
ncbi:MAG TPA: type II toxin-antitoxin system RelE/ParE family toxin [Gemmatimonadales bacterium]|nr:type II toxin-antitoxin system RelE/ParE family toxin [Gemmatimonadales bacterium]HRZ08683.1 type II toxin-antitoxin system RelE/ParE family toxin [Gemmatimonadales bacterium]